MNNKENVLLNLINDTFVNKHEETLNLLKVYELSESVFHVIEVIDKTQGLEKKANPTLISSLSSTFLTNINTKIASITETDEKENLQYILSELSKQLLARFINNSPLGVSETLKYISSGLEVTCTLNNWNFNELSQRLNFDLLHTIAAKEGSKTIVIDQEVKPIEKPSLSYYEWGESEGSLEELAYFLKDKKTIKSVKEFLSLFKRHENQIQVRFNINHLNFIIILFDELYRIKLLAVRGNRAKHFTPLKKYAIDFEKRVLIKSEPKHIKYKIKKNTQLYNALREQIDNWISLI